MGCCGLLVIWCLLTHNNAGLGGTEEWEAIKRALFTIIMGELIKHVANPHFVPSINITPLSLSHKGGSDHLSWPEIKASPLLS